MNLVSDLHKVLNSKQHPTCTQPGCIGWIEMVQLRGETWRKCRLCGFMELVKKRLITPLGNK